MSDYIPTNSDVNRRKDWVRLRRLVLERDRGTCAMCPFRAVVEVHHITAVADGGANTLGNLITLCPNHHALVHAGLIKSGHLHALAVKRNAAMQREAEERDRAMCAPIDALRAMWEAPRPMKNDDDDLSDILPGFDNHRNLSR